MRHKQFNDFCLSLPKGKATLWVIVALIVVMAVRPGAGTALAGMTSLYESVEQALKTNPQLQAIIHNREAATFDLRQARGEYWPTIDISLGYGLEQYSDRITRRPEADPSASNWDSLGKAVISLTQNIYDGGKTGSQIGVQKALLDSADHQLRAAEQSVALNAVIAHLHVFLYRHLTAISERNVGIQRDIYSNLLAREQAGVSNIGDVSQARARLARAEATLAGHQSDLSQTIANYVRVIGAPPADLAYAGVPETLPQTLEEALQKAEQDNPELLALGAEITEADSRLALARSRYKPQLALELKSQYSDQLEGDPSWQQTDEAMLLLRWNLFNGGRDQAGVSSSLSRKNQNVSKRLAKLTEVREAASTAWNNYLSLQRQKAANRDALDSGHKAFEAYLTQFSVGRRSLLDLLIVENEYFQSAVQLATAATQETIAAYRILALMGALQVPLPSDAPVCPEHWDLLSRALVFPEVAKLLATTAFAPEGQAPAAGVAVDGETAGDNGAEKPASAGSASTPLGKGEAGFSGVPDAKAISAGAVAPTRRGYPFSLLLGSYGDMAQARRAVETDGKGEMVRYWVKVDLGADGIRYRVFGGYFATAAAAQKAAFKHRLNPLAVKATRYAVQIGAAGDRHKADANVEILRQKGFSPYVVALDENVYATYLGAFYTEKGANDLLAELGPLPMDCRVVER